jgi:hypothetical protein
MPTAASASLGSQQVAQHPTPGEGKLQMQLVDGMSCEAIAKVLLLDDDTIRTWYRLYEEDGIEGLTNFGYPDGSMTASGLRREAARGRLVIERTAGKDYTTLANIDRMRELCRVEAKGHDCGSNLGGATRRGDSSDAPYTSSGTARPSAALVSAKAKLKQLKGSLPNIKSPDTAHRDSATEIPAPSKLPM